MCLGEMHARQNGKRLKDAVDTCVHGAQSIKGCQPIDVKTPLMHWGGKLLHTIMLTQHAHQLPPVVLRDLQ